MKTEENISVLALRSHCSAVKMELFENAMALLQVSSSDSLEKASENNSFASSRESKDEICSKSKNANEKASF